MNLLSYLKFSITPFAFIAIIFTACDSDNSSSAHDIEDIQPSSSSIFQQNDDIKVSSSAAISSSSIIESSSQQIVEESSSSQELSSSSSAEPEESSSSLFIPPADSAWTYLNPEISYGELVDERDGQIYKTVMVGDREWMAQNLNYADSVNTPSLLGNSWCYDNDPAMCYRYGRLYTWAAAIDSVTQAKDGKKCGMGDISCSFVQGIQGICPKGWHIPSANEIHKLFYAGASSIITWSGIDTYKNSGKNLKSASGWIDERNGIDSLGYSVLPAGSRNPGFRSLTSPHFNGAGSSTVIWTSSRAKEDISWVIKIDEDDEDFIKSSSGKNNGFSIRCIKDSTSIEQE